MGFHLGAMMAEVHVVGLSKKQRKRETAGWGSGTWWRRWRAMTARLGLLCMTPSMGQSRRRGAGAGQSCTIRRETNTTRPVW